MTEHYDDDETFKDSDYGDPNSVYHDIVRRSAEFEANRQGYFDDDEESENNSEHDDDEESENNSEQSGGKRRKKRRSTKRKSTKRKSTKRKSKRRSTKRRSTKRRSTKRKSKRRSTKRRSTKRKSIKRKSTKRRSTKRSSKKNKLATVKKTRAGGLQFKNNKNDWINISKSGKDKYYVFHVFINSSGKPHRTYNTETSKKTFQNMLKPQSGKVVKGKSTFYVSNSTMNKLQDML
jgi:hypothetical protein